MKKTPTRKPVAKKKRETATPRKRVWNGAGAPALAAERRGKRGHSIIDDVPGLGEWIVEQCLQVPRPTLDDLLDRLKSTNFLQQLEDIGQEKRLSRSTLHEFVAQWKAFAIAQGLERSRRRVAIDNARSLNESNDDDELFEIDNAIATTVNVDVLERLQAARAKGLPPDEDLREDLKVAARYQTARTMRARVRFLINRGLRRVEGRVIERMSAVLKKRNPEVLPFVREALREAIAEEAKQP